MKRILIAFTLACVLSCTALAGDMPTDGRSATGEMPGIGSTPTPGATPASVPGDMPGVGPATSSETGSSLVTTLLLTIFTLIGR